MHKVYVWDFPTRAFHWLLVLAILSQYVTAEILDDAIQLHFYGGYFVLGLIIFRLIWGVIGHYYSRFSVFLSSPSQTIGYITNKEPQQYLTHNPLGAWSVVLILTLVTTQAVSGLFIDDDIFHQGPYHSLVSAQVADIANWLHHNVIKIILAVVVIHIVAVIIYQFKGQRLVQGMLSGYKISDKPAHRPSKQSLFLSIIAIICAAALVYVLVAVIPPEPSLYDY